MKIYSTRKAISQSMDLFIIVAAVLAVGGIVTATIFGLGGTMTRQSALQVTSPSLSASLGTFAFSLKNTGTTTLTGAITVTINGTVATVTTTDVPSSPGEIVAVSGTTGKTFAIGTQYLLVVTFGGATASLPFTAQ